MLKTPSFLLCFPRYCHVDADFLVLLDEMIVVNLTKKQSISWSPKKLILILCTVSIAVAAPAYAEVLTCEVGDTTKGYWEFVSKPGACTYPGPPDANSPWPVFDYTSGSMLTMGPYYRIEGVHKMEVSVTAPAGSYDMPPAMPECIAGVAKAFAAAMGGYYQRSGVPVTVSGTLLTFNFLPSPNYCRYREYNFTVSEWKCYPQLPESPIIKPDPPSCDDTGSGSSYD